MFFKIVRFGVYTVQYNYIIYIANVSSVSSLSEQTEGL